jgi:mRNA interferase MazF
MTFGDIVLVPFPFTDESGVKVRPAVVVAEVAIGRNQSDLILICITSNIGNLKSHDLLLETCHPDFPLTRLRQNSAIRTHKILTLQRSTRMWRLGRLGESHRQELKKKILSLLP